MATKPIIDIEVNDEAFRRFAELFAKYQEQVKSTPAAWKKVSDEVDAVLDKTATGVDEIEESTDGVSKAASAAAVAFRQTYININNQASQLDKTKHAQYQMELSAKRQSSYWHEMAKNAKGFAQHIVGATRSLLSWARLTSILGGLLGAGGLFGIDRLAASAGRQRRSALGLGVTAGEERAFNLDYGRVVDPTNFLSGVNEALHDVTKRQSLYAAGLTEKDIQGKDTAEVSATLIQHLKKIADQTDPAMMQQVLTSRGLDQFITLQDFQRLRNTPAAEFQKYGEAYQNDRRNLNVSDAQLRAWQDLQTQLSRAGTEIQNVLINGLSNLSGPIGDLSKAFATALEAFLKAPVVRGWIEDLASALEWTAKYIGSDNFKQDIQNFTKGVSDFASAVGEAVKTIMGWVSEFNNWAHSDKSQIFQNGGVNGPLTDDNPNAPGSPAFYDQLNKKRAAQGLPPITPWHLFGDKSDRDKTFPGYAQPAPDGASLWNRMKNWWLGSPQGDTDPIKKEAFNTLEDRNGLPRGLLQNVEYTESRGRDVTSPAGAEGYFQFMPGTARRFGVNPHDEYSSANGAARYFRSLMDMFNGDVEKAVAAYNWGEGNVQRDVAQYGSAWRDHLPDETRNYIRSVLGGAPLTSRPPAAARGGGATITINNNTGGNAVVSASQLAV